MSPSQVVIGGILRTDGTLELSGRPDLPAGPVEVTIRSLPAEAEEFAGEDPWQYLQRARAELEASGHRFRTQEEIDADIEDMRSGDERIEEIYRQIEAERRREKAE
jgi:hypothetical protein